MNPKYYKRISITSKRTIIVRNSFTQKLYLIQKIKLLFLLSYCSFRNNCNLNNLSRLKQILKQLIFKICVIIKKVFIDLKIDHSLEKLLEKFRPEKSKYGMKNVLKIFVRVKHIYLAPSNYDLIG